MILYKFKSLDQYEHVVEMLATQEVYCARPSQLNDPLEGILGVDKEALGLDDPNLIDTRPGEPFMARDVKYYIGDTVDKCRVCCFSENPDSVLMWTYYGGSHSGVCLELEVDDNLWPVHQVEYVDDLSKVDTSWPDYRLRYKLKQWEHEREHRIIFSEFDAQRTHVSVLIKAVIVGSSLNSRHVRSLKALCERFGYRTETMAFTAEGRAFRSPGISGEGA